MWNCMWLRQGNKDQLWWFIKCLFSWKQCRCRRYIKSLQQFSNPPCQLLLRMVFIEMPAFHVMYLILAEQNGNNMLYNTQQYSMHIEWGLCSMASKRYWLLWVTVKIICFSVTNVFVIILYAQHIAGIFNCWSKRFQLYYHGAPLNFIYFLFIF